MLTELQLAKIPNLFHMFDGDNSGHMEERDIVHIINQCAENKGWSNTDPRYNEFYDTFYGLWIGMTTLADKNANDQIELSEFLDFFEMVMQDDENYNTIVSGISYGVFSMFDLDDDGTLTAAEYRTFYEKMGLDVDYAEKIYTYLDLDKDGTISVEELARLVDQFFRSQDKTEPGNHFFGPIV